LPMDAWIVAVVTDSPMGRPPIATLFVAEGGDQQAVEAAVRGQITAPIHSVEISSLSPEIAMAFKLRPAEVRRLP
jgi:hypothetical protein